MPARFLPGMIAAALAALALALPAVAQQPNQSPRPDRPAPSADSLLGDPGDRGVCTCATVRPPNDCAAALAKPKQIAEQHRAEIRSQCAKQWRERCEKQLGWETCATPEAKKELTAACDPAVEAWWAQAIAPQISEMTRQCNEANQGWTKQCQTVDQPQSCKTCKSMHDEIAKLQKDIGDTRTWIQGVRNGTELITSQTDAQMSQRLDEVDRWERELREKQEGYKLLLDSNFCPKA